MKILKSEREYIEFIKRKQALVMFCTMKCGACVIMNKVINDGRAELRARFPRLEIAKVDCSTIPKYTAHIKFVPTLSLFVNGNEQIIDTGTLSLEKLTDKVRRALEG